MKTYWNILLHFLENGKEAVMAKLIQFYVPANFRPPKARWTPAELRGKIIEFSIVRTRKSA